MPDHASDIEDALTIVERAGVHASCVQGANGWFATATDGTGHTWQVTADTALQAVTELMDAMGLRDLD